MLRALHSTHEKWSRWQALGANDRRETLRAAMLVAVSELGLRLFGLKRTLGWLQQPTKTTDRLTTDRDALTRAANAIERVRCHSPVTGTCLSRSVALERLLRRSGIACELRIGVRRVADAVAGHAWVEVNGRPINDTADVHREFAPLHK